ncbi:MAG: Gldg family protein [Planctomycetes bacterium]|nr:Gldg family protein [Planctomycetota bacterium]
MKLKELCAQSLAISRAELLRMASSPAWAILLFLWTLVCGLFFSIVIDHSAANALPAGETPMSYFFRAAPFLLPLLLIVFIPQLTMEVVAGRRERGRLEHLLISGLRPGALIIGGFSALLLLNILLLIPPILFHCIIAMHADPDLGRTLCSLAALYCIGACISALGLAVSCWAPSRLSASLIALSIGICWWIIDFFKQQIAGDAQWAMWFESFQLTKTIFDSATGLISPKVFASFVFLSIGFLFIARCGLDAKRFPGPRIFSAIMSALICICMIMHVHNWNNTWDMTSHNSHSLSEEIILSTETLMKEGGLHISLASTPHMRNDVIDGPIYERCHHILQRLQNHGLSYEEIDPGHDPYATRELSRELTLDKSDWKHPLLIVRYLNQHLVLRTRDLAIFESRHDGVHLQALRAESALLAAMHRLHDGRSIKIAFLQGEYFRPLEGELLHQRDHSLQSAYQRLKGEGYIVGTCKNLTAAKDNIVDVLIIPGPQRDFSAADIEILRQLNTNGTSILLLLDGQQDNNALVYYKSFFLDMGIDWQSGFCSAIEQRKKLHVSSSLDLASTNTTGPLAILEREKRRLYMPWTTPMFYDKQLIERWHSSSYAPIPETYYMVDKQNTARIIGTDAYAIICSELPRDSALTSRIAVCASIDAVSDVHLHQKGNRLLLSALCHWLSRKKIVYTLPPRQVQSQRFTLSSQQQFLLNWVIGIGLPLSSALLGFYIARRRRRHPRGAQLDA